jgi:hypothetical protein
VIVEQKYSSLYTTDPMKARLPIEHAEAKVKP